jgi:hypothetical protein
VSALAVRAHAQVIVTYNLKHFPPASIAQYEVEAQHPDEFLMNLYGIDRLTMVQLVIDQAADLTRREMTPQELLDKMHRVGLKTFAHAIRQDLDPGGP